MTVNPIFIIAGPTASGKSARALELAAERDGVIVNADSMQVYDALPILTAQPDAEDRAAAPHRLYGFQDPAKWFSAGNWREAAMAEIAAILADGRTPIVVGGSGLYLKALVEGFSPIPDIPPEVRQRAIDRQAERGNPGFHAELAARDPVMGARLHPYHTARLIRSWEVIEATGKSLSHFQSLPRETPPADWRFIIEKIMPGREELHARIDRRFDRMMETGAVEEVAAFAARLDSGAVPEDTLLARALGFKPLRAWLAGETTRADAVAQAKLETRQYAKRQMTWFRNQL